MPMAIQILSITQDGDFSAFSTEAPCDKLPTDLTTSAGNNANTTVTMSWDTPEGIGAQITTS